MADKNDIPISINEAVIAPRSARACNASPATRATALFLMSVISILAGVLDAPAIYFLESID